MAASAEYSAWFLLGSGVESQEASSVLKLGLAKARAGGQRGCGVDDGDRRVRLRSVWPDPCW